MGIFKEIIRSQNGMTLVVLEQTTAQSQEVRIPTRDSEVIGGRIRHNISSD